MSTVTTPPLKLGELVFKVKTCSSDFADELSSLLPGANREDQCKEIHEVNAGCVQDIRGLFSYVLRRNRDVLWLNSACVISDSGKLILLSGKSHSGKSTTTMSIAMLLGWRILSEDLVLINKNREILSFATPFSAKEGTKELLAKEFGRDIELISNEWMSLAGNRGPDKIGLPVDFIFHLELPEPGTKMVIETLDQSEYVRRMLRWSNALRLPEGTQRLIDCSTSVPITLLLNGSIRERIDYIVRLVA